MLAAVVLILLLVIGCGNKDAITVYVTETGSKYHRDGCEFLANSKIPVTLDKAKKEGYEPCKVCKPPK